MSDPRQTANPEICAQWDWCPYCKNGLDTGLQCDQCLADLMPVQEALRDYQRLRADHARLTEQAEGVRKALVCVMAYQEIREYIGSQLSALADAAIDASREGK